MACSPAKARERSRSPPQQGIHREPFVLNFVTTNLAKFEHLRACVKPLLDSNALKLTRIGHVDLPELQADSIETIAAAKAKAAWETLGGAVVVHDSGLVIKALSDFPGPYTKYVISKIGIEGLLRLLDGRKGDDRRCGFDMCVAFCDRAGSVRCFSDPVRYFGKLAESPSEQRNGGGQSAEGRELFRVFIPCDEAAPRHVTLSEFTAEELEKYRATRASAYQCFAVWLTQRLDATQTQEA